ncbi:MAG: hypothetical protein JJU36_11245 [Phycisphaeraceae bacterium]|nr:hypothetical protein [Phycisphaeraceae bacterium]
MAKDSEPQPKAQETFYDAKFSIEAIQHEPYETGFTWRTVVGAFFIAFVMLPGIIFMGLMIGQDMGTAADWVTIILFVELARRSFIQLRKQELYILKYTVSHLSHISGGVMLGGGVFAYLIFNRYMTNSEAFANFGIGHKIPIWFSPYGDQAFEPLTSSVWLPAMAVMVGSMVLSKLTQLSLGFLSYKVTSDVEKLPFPLAPIHAEGAIALAETSQEKNKRGYRQYCFSIGVMIGAVFGLFYVAIPTLSQAFLGRPITLLPIPFLDLTTTFEHLLPGGTIGIALNLGLLFTGFVLPWRIVVGMFFTTIAFQLAINPLILQPLGYLPNWQPGKDAIQTHVAATLDVYLSVGIGTAFAVFFVGLFGMVRAWRKFSAQRRRERMDAVAAASSSPAPGAGEASDSDEVGQRVVRDFDKVTVDPTAFWRRDKERGDPSTGLAIGVWLLASAGYVALSYYLINDGVEAEERFSIWWLIGFAFLWTPINTYINARMSGIAGQSAGVPFVFESAVFISQHRGLNIWFAPLPLQNYGGMSDLLRETQLTRTRFTSILKAELLIFPLMLVASFIFWNYVDSLGPIPSENYPYVEKFWPQFAQIKAVWATGLREGQSMLMEAIKPGVIAFVAIGCTALFGLFHTVGLSAQYIYGGIGAMNGYPHMAIPIFIGACLGRFYLARRFGRERWTNYAPILAVGFGAGLGLTGMLAIAINFLWTSVGVGY